jgi:hypothetical protein
MGGNLSHLGWGMRESKRGASPSSKITLNKTKLALELTSEYNSLLD